VDGDIADRSYTVASRQINHKLLRITPSAIIWADEVLLLEKEVVIAEIGAQTAVLILEDSSIQVYEFTEAVTLLRTLPSVREVKSICYIPLTNLCIFTWWNTSEIGIYNC
jgi:hypothetical protein